MMIITCVDLTFKFLNASEDVKVVNHRNSEGALAMTGEIVSKEYKPNPSVSF